jgi:hypothetical protein
VTDEVMPNSGYTITHTVWRNKGSKKWRHKAVKAGADVTVGVYTATAGAGVSTSPTHTL